MTILPTKYIGTDKQISSLLSIPTRVGQQLVRLAVPRPNHQRLISSVMFIDCVRVWEFICISGLALLILHLIPFFPITNSFLLITLTVSFSGWVVWLFNSLNLYNPSGFTRLLTSSLRISIAWSLVCLCLAGILYSADIMQNHLLSFFEIIWPTCLIALIISRIATYITYRTLQRAGCFNCYTVLLGGGEPLEKFIDELNNQPIDTHIRLLGFFDDRGNDRSPNNVRNIHKLGKFQDLINFTHEKRVDLIIFTIPMSAEQRLLQLIKTYFILPIDIRLAAETSNIHFRPNAYSYIGNIPLLDVFDKPITDWHLVLKSLFDRTMGSIFLVLLSPLFALIALAVKMESKGPIFFKQQRYGFNNDLIEIYKFRSMYTDQADPGANKLVTKNDPRVTPLGRFLRRTSLDELPQLINVVWKGNLSLVGPRPHAVHAKAENKEYFSVVEEYFARHRVKPGMTGWAQVNGWRGETDTQEKIRQRVTHDLYYIENWSFLLDIRILIRTPLALLKGENAY